MNNPLMPKSTAVWLIDNTALTFEQISKFCNLHILEVQGIADGEVAVGIQGKNPVTSGELTLAEIKRCEGDSTQFLNKLEDIIPLSSEILNDMLFDSNLEIINNVGHFHPLESPLEVNDIIIKNL